jgi:hypothetical protein
MMRHTTRRASTALEGMSATAEELKALQLGGICAQPSGSAKIIRLVDAYTGAPLTAPSVELQRMAART